MKRLICMPLILVIVLFASVAFPENGSLWIEPGVGIGKVKLGDTRDAVVLALGVPSDTFFDQVAEKAMRDMGLVLGVDLIYLKINVNSSQIDDFPEGTPRGAELPKEIR